MIMVEAELPVRPSHRPRAPRPVRTLRRLPAAAALSAALSLGLLVSGCGGTHSAAPAPDEEILLQPATGAGPDPYTATTVRELSVPAPGAALPGSGAAKAERGLVVRTLSGATPGLYGGTRSAGSCDVERQLSLLGADPVKAAAFARGAGIGRPALAGFLRSLTPVVLRADTRVTSHGFRGGAARARQAVLQAGTAVLVDRHGEPRVRCACGNPLKAPVAVKGGVLRTGRSWAGFQPDRIVVVRPAAQVLNSLVIVDVAQNIWIDRDAGSDGEHDRRPDILPPVAPDDVYVYPPVTASPVPEPPGATGRADDPGNTGTATATTDPAGPAADCSSGDPLAADCTGTGTATPVTGADGTVGESGTDAPPGLPDEGADALPDGSGDPLTYPSAASTGPATGADPGAGPSLTGASPADTADSYDLPETATGGREAADSGGGTG
jgi:hypothetical protein